MPGSWMRAAAAGLSGALLLVPCGVQGAAADGGGTGGSGGGWIEEELSEADRVGAELTGDGELRLPHAAPAGSRLATGEPSALVTFPGHPVEEAARAVAVRLDASGAASGLLVQARGVRVDGQWTEWRGERTEPKGPGELRVTIELPEPVARLQLRIGTAVGAEYGVPAAQRRETGAPAGVLSAVRLRPVDLPHSGKTGSEPDTDPGPEGGAEAESDTGPEDAEARDESATERARPFSARVFATRIGQVGEQTANGHRIGEGDHFVALPSRRGLSERGGGDYTVRVCTGADGATADADSAAERRGGAGHSQPRAAVSGTQAAVSHAPPGSDAGRCVYAPVWDVGPWNITDDHWSADRERWRDLPRGLPQAQAAYQEDYNGGRDGFGRRVRNPAGIDLADGTFREGLRLSTNAWVRVDYLWTAEYAHRAAISAGDGAKPVPVRSGPGTSYAERGLAAASAVVDVACRAPGDEVTGPQGVSAQWFRIGAADYVPAAYVRGGDGAPLCPEQE